MAVLNLTMMWVNRLDTGDSVSGQSSIQRGRQHSVDGEVSTWAGGRQRASMTDGERGQFAFTLRILSLTTVEKLRTWIGIPVQVRDARGQRFFGVFFSVEPKEWRESAIYDVDIALRVITYVEGV